jgi:hypothetical protein
MAEEIRPAQSTQPSERIQKYRQEVQALIQQGGEQPRFEFKRAASLKRENLDGRYGFIKLLQGLANAEIDGERCIVIGADPKQKRFFRVDNADEFDAAKISQILSAHLEPLPRFNVFHVTTDAEEHPFVLIVLEANQPRPIFITKEGHTEDGKERLQLGEVWVKKNTGLVHATRADIDLMYEARIEKEAEDRARKRLQHLLEISTAGHRQQPPASRPPDFTLLVGPKSELRSFASEQIAVGEFRRFRMLVEMARDALIDGWDNLKVKGGTTRTDFPQFVKEVGDFFRDQFLPSLQSIVELAALGIKYETDADLWLSPLIDLLLDAFDASRHLDLLKSQHVLQAQDRLKWWQPGFEVYVAIRTIAVYAVARKRLSYLRKILPNLVTPISIDDRPAHKVPALFWPFLGLQFTSGELDQGRSSYLWKARVDSSWGQLFGIFPRFLEASSQLEFLLELNSYFGTNTLQDPTLKKFLSENLPDVTFRYLPDLYSQDLQATVPMAELIYDVFCKIQPFPPHLAVDPRIFDLVIVNMQPSARLHTYASFLVHLKSWQEQYMLQGLGRYPFFYDWESRLEKIVLEYHKQQSHPRSTT